MEGATTALSSQPFSPESQHSHTNAIHGFHHQGRHGHATLVSQLDPSLQGLDQASPFTSSFDPQLVDSSNVFEQGPHQTRFHGTQSHAGHAPRRQQKNPFQQPGQFGVLTPPGRIVNGSLVQHDSIARLQQEHDLLQNAEPGGGKTEGHFANMKVVPDPPNLQAWRKRLFDVNEIITMTEEE